MLNKNVLLLLKSMAGFEWQQIRCGPFMAEAA